MSEKKKFCVFCRVKDENVILFTLSTLKKCEYILKCRKKYQLKFNNVVLPQSANETDCYHRTCHNNFLALKQKYKDVIPLIPSDNGDNDVEMQKSCFGNNPSTSADSESYETDVNKKDDACFICNKSRVTVNKKVLSLVTSSNKDILDQLDKAAESVGDEETRRKINACRDLPSFRYHKRCKLTITYKEQQKQSKLLNSENVWHIIREFHKIAFEEICAFVEDNVIKMKMYYYVDFLRKLYNDSMRMQIHESNAELSYPDIQSSKLESKLMKRYSKDIEFRLLIRKKVVHPRNMVIPENFSTEPLDKIDLLQRAAITLRQEIFSIEKRELPNAINATEIGRGECTIPDSVQIFYETLLSGGSSRRRRSEKCKRLSSSFAQDVVFEVTNGQVKPAKKSRSTIVEELSCEEHEEAECEMMEHKICIE